MNPDTVPPSRLKIDLPVQALVEFCRRNSVRRLSVFGSALRDDFTPESDVDFLVEFEPGRTPGLDFFGMEIELSEIIGRKADFNTAGFLSRHIRDHVRAEAVPVYVAPGLDGEALS